MNTEPAEILTLADAAGFLGVKPDWLQRSTCPRAKIGGKVFWLRSVCLAWVRAHLVPSLDDERSA